MIKNIEIAQDIIEPAIHSCSELCSLTLDIVCEALSLKDIYYLKNANFKLGRFDHMIHISNCPNLENLQVHSIITLT